jgi:hypothetical protein
MLRRPAVLFAGKRTMATGNSARSAADGHMKTAELTDEDYYYCDTCVQD